MISLDEYRGLSAERRHALTIMTFWAEPVDARRLVSLMTDAEGNSIPVERAKKILSHFHKRWALSLHSLEGQAFYMESSVSRAAYEEMVREADAMGWWPRVDVAGKAPHDDLFPELHRYREESPTEPSTTMLISEGLRCLAIGSGLKASKHLGELLMGAEDDDASSSAFIRAIAACAGTRFGEEPAFLMSRGDPLLEVMPAWLSVCFGNGLSVSNALQELHRLLLDGVSVSMRLRETYCSLCIWTGKTQWLAPALKGADNSIADGCGDILTGGFKSADRVFKSSPINFRPERDDRERDYDNLPVRFLMAMASAVANPDKPARKRPSDLMFFCGGICSYRVEALFAAVKEERRIERLSNSASGNWEALGKGHRQLDSLEKNDPMSPIPALIAAWEYHQLRIGRKAFGKQAARIWEYAKTLDKAGWSSLANLLSALLTGGYDSAEETEYLRDLDGRSVAFLERRNAEPGWKKFLEELQKSVSGNRKSQGKETTDVRRIVWNIAMSRMQAKGCYWISSVSPMIRYAGDDEGRNDEFLDHFDLDKVKVRKLMTEKDLLIATMLYDSSYYRNYSQHELVKCLCGAPNLFRRDSIAEWSHRRAKSTPMTLEERQCELEASVGEDGCLVLQAPEWATACDKPWCIRDLGDGRYALVMLSNEVKKILDVIAEFGSDGRVVIPRDGIQQAEPILEGIASVMPLAEPTEGAEKLRRIPAGSGIRLRLDYTDGVLVVHAVVQPLPENPNLTFDPVVGPVEKLVVGTVSSFVLVRNLSLEAAALEPVHAVLEEFEDAFDGKSTWRFECLADAIAALAKLRSLGDRAPLDWIDNRRLAVAQAPKSGVKITSQRTADDWFRVDGSFELDDGRILTIVEILDAARSRKGNFVKLSDGDYLALTTAMAKELDALNAAGRRKGDGVEIVKAAIPMLDGVFGQGEETIELPDAMAVTAREIRSAFAKRPSIPRTLNAKLRKYQEDGFRWLSRLASCGFGSCLADDMGLGKTVQVISLLLERAKHGASLVIAPSSVCGNWRRELERFAPTLRPIMAFEKSDSLSTVKANDVVIASYGYLLFHEDEFVAVTWNGVVLDEAQAIKNDASRRAKMVKRLHAKFRVAATGTPVENRLGELWSLFDFLNPGLLGPAASFAQRFTVDGKAVPELKRLVKPLILRRIKGDVLDDLPDKTEVMIPVVLNESERTAYEACRRQALAQLAKKAECDGAANRMSILAELTRLRRFCCHPSLVLPGMNIPSAKMEALVDLLEGLHDGHHRALVFSQFTDYLALVRKTIDAHKWTHLYLDGSTPTLEREKLVNAFQGGEGDFFLISLKAGGTGLNLTAANYVILLDPWWNPAVENQAADRAHRIGQKNPVTVYRLISSDTVEARVIELHREKKAIAEDVLEGTSSTSLSPAQLMKLFA